MKFSLLMTYSGTEKKTHRILNELSIDRCFFVQEISARAIDDAKIPFWQACFALRFGFRLKQFTQFDVVHKPNHFLILDQKGYMLDFVVDIRTYMSASFTNIFSWLKLPWSITDLPVRTISHIKNYPRFINGLPRNGSLLFFEESSSSWKINIDLLRTGRFSFILHSNHVMCDNGFLRSLTNWI